MALGGIPGGQIYGGSYMQAPSAFSYSSSANGTAQPQINITNNNYGSEVYGGVSGAQSFLGGYSQGPSNGECPSPSPYGSSASPYGSFPSPQQGCSQQPPTSTASTSTQQPATDDDGTPLTSQKVGWGQHVGDRIDSMDNHAQSLLNSGKITQSQYDQITSLTSGVSSQLLQDDANDDGKKLTKSDFSTAGAALAQAQQLM